MTVDVVQVYSGRPLGDYDREGVIQDIIDGELSLAKIADKHGIKKSTVAGVKKMIDSGRLVPSTVVPPTRPILQDDDDFEEVPPPPEDFEELPSPPTDWLPKPLEEPEIEYERGQKVHPTGQPDKEGYVVRIKGNKVFVLFTSDGGSIVEYDPADIDAISAPPKQEPVPLPEKPEPTPKPKPIKEPTVLFTMFGEKGDYESVRGVPFKSNSGDMEFKPTWKLYKALDKIAPRFGYKFEYAPEKELEWGYTTISHINPNLFDIALKLMQEFQNATGKQISNKTKVRVSFTNNGPIVFDFEGSRILIAPKTNISGENHPYVYDEPEDTTVSATGDEDDTVELEAPTTLSTFKKIFMADGDSNVNNFSNLLTGYNPQCIVSQDETLAFLPSETWKSFLIQEVDEGRFKYGAFPNSIGRVRDAEPEFSSNRMYYFEMTYQNLRNISTLFKQLYKVIYSVDKDIKTFDNLRFTIHGLLNYDPLTSSYHGMKKQLIIEADGIGGISDTKIIGEFREEEDEG